MFRLRPVYVLPICRSRASHVAVAGAPEGAVAEVGAAAQTAAAGLVWLVAAGVEGAFAYALYTGKWIFETKHPVWGTIFALLTISNLYAAGDEIMKSGSES